jgi:hypothetical protein
LFTTNVTLQQMVTNGSAASNCHFEVWHRPPGEAAAARAGMRLLTSQLGPG